MPAPILYFTFVSVAYAARVKLHTLRSVPTKARSAKKSIFFQALLLICTKISSNRAVERDASGCVWYFVKGQAYRRWDHEGNDCIHPHNSFTLPLTCLYWNAHTAKLDIRVQVYYHIKIVVCVLENVCWKGWGVDPFMYVVLNYRACLLFNRSAQELMPQPMSQPSCIIAPVCQCQRLGKATSDCCSPLSPFFAFYLYPSFPLSPSVFILIRLISFSSRAMQRKTVKEWAYWIYWRQSAWLKKIVF